MVNYNPVTDEKKEFDIDEWAALAKSEIDLYVAEWKNVNEFHKNKHTWSIWMNSFISYMSW